MSGTPFSGASETGNLTVSAVSASRAKGIRVIIGSTLPGGDAEQTRSGSGRIGPLPEVMVTS
jgi:hypothetical protein